ncbi:MAG: ferrochelatase [Bacteroidota bacterium]|nr:ferrochelatase [Bacteroidota bacterium]
MAEKVILLTNLGSPDSTEVKDVRTYLNEFLMDKRVIDIPFFARLLLVKGIIVPLRAPKSAAKYKTIWTDNGSPLIHITKQLTEAVEKESGIPTYMCMRYANPTPQSVLETIVTEHPDLKEITMLPLYPHYAMSSYETAVLHVKDTYKAGDFKFQLKVVEPFYKHPDFIEALADSIKPFTEKHFDHILFSYHGIPERHVKKTDPTKNHCLSCTDCCNIPSETHKFCYRHQVIQTTKAVAKTLSIPDGKFSFSFQSRLGTDSWLKPYSAKLFKEMPNQGIKNLIVVCPAFVSDCLETLEEICVEGKEDFEKAGGETFSVVPCLNINTKWVKTAIKLVNEIV